MANQTVELQPGDTTSVDDVRRVREQIAAEHAGDLRGHIAETNRIFQELRGRLGLNSTESDPVPPQVQQQVISQYKSKAEEE